MENFITSEQVTETVVLDELGEALNVQAGGMLQTGDDNAVLIQNTLNSVDVENTGLIESNQTAIQVDGDGASINNEGEISGGFNGINIANGNTASAQIRNEGLITSESRAINIGGQAGVVNNFGTITTSADPRNGTIYGDITARNIVINNEESGIIDVGAGNNGDAISLETGRASGSINNDGLIQGRGLPGITNPNNQSSAIRFYTPERRGQFTGDVNNSGTLAAENGPAVVVEDNITLRGNINNSGLIESANPANGIGVLFEDGSNFRGTLTNSGTINGGRDGVSFGNGGTARGRLVNEEGGIITSTSRAVNIGGNRNIIRNKGLITTSADPRNGTIYADQSPNNFRIFNESTGVVDVGEGLNGDAISLQLGANVRGSVINRGTVLGRGNTDGPQNNATNQATAIRLYHGDGAGPVSAFDGDIRNLGNGLLSSETDHAILIESQVQFNGDIFNSGQIVSDGNDAIRTEGEFRGDIINRGNIVAEGDGIQISQTFTGNINNSGNITAIGEGIDLRDVSGTGEFIFAGDINNRGTIVGNSGGIRIDDDVVFTDDINNSGSILSNAVPADGIDIEGSLLGTINNSGLIQAEEFAIDGNNANDSLAVINSGTIIGNARLSDFDDIFNGANGIVRGEIQGLEGDDLLIGGRLRDTLVGGEGNDTLIGGAGRDTFVVEQLVGNGSDIITDFQNGVDRIDITALDFSAHQLSSLLGAAQQQGNNVLLELSATPGPSGTATDSILLQDFQLNQLDASDFVV